VIPGTINGFDYLGAELVKPAPMSWGRGILALAAGALGAVLVPKHPMLAFLNTAALASNVHAVAKGERTAKDAIKRMGRHVVATAGSLALPKYPAMGYVAGAIAAELLIDGEGGGIIEEWSDYEGIRNTPKREVLDAEFSEVKPTKALVRT
jgi:hypothetical protein